MLSLSPETGLLTVLSGLQLLPSSLLGTLSPPAGGTPHNETMKQHKHEIITNIPDEKSQDPHPGHQESRETKHLGWATETPKPRNSNAFKHLTQSKAFSGEAPEMPKTQQSKALAQE